VASHYVGKFQGQERYETILRVRNASVSKADPMALPCFQASDAVSDDSATKSKSDIASGFDEQQAMKSIVTVQGTKGSGSAFLVNVKGRKLLVTNIHVVFDNDPKFLSVANERIEVSEPQFASDRDLAFYELKEPERFPALELEGDITRLQQEEQVVVFGNSLGAGVNTRLRGKVMGVGPTTLEISAKIVPGNSGSPILDLSSGKVLGVSTYGSQIRRVDFSIKGTRFEEVRRFGTRVDTVNMDALEPFDKAKYAADVKLYNTVTVANELGNTLLTDICEQKNGRFSPTIEPSRYSFSKYPSLERAIREWNDIINGKISVSNRSISNVPNALKGLKSQISMPLMNARKQQANYSWVKDNVAKQIELNDCYCKAFDDMRKDIDEYMRSK
jgi:hypothetical protein